jgi:site-specific recombinase XerD
MLPILHLTFWIYKSKLTSKGMAPIYLRITIKGQKTELATGVNTSPSQWNSKRCQIKGNSVEARELNLKLQNLKEKVLEAYNELLSRGIPVSPEMVKSKAIGSDDQSVTLLYALEYHNALLQKKNGTTASQVKYQTLKRKVVEFIYQEYNRKDLFLKELNYQFVVKFEAFLKSTQQIKHNTAIKYIQFLKKITNLSIAHGWLQQNPFSGFKCSLLPVHRGYLSQKEISVLSHRQFNLKRLEAVKDVFLLSCYTGLAYVDIKELTSRHIVQKDDGTFWIIIHRRKTGTRSPIPLLTPAQSILNKYKGLLTDKNQHLLPVISNQKMNAYLKEIGEVCGIEKNLTFHLARHTFATTVTLTNGVPIETVSKMLGHTSLKTTQIYAKVVDTKIQEDMRALEIKLMSE